ncbi:MULTISPECIES: 23S rRNA (guanosine(2251)-2'-O)-methyltransferase RlmB [Salimicrobium]|uniref:23S rRNA (Guanosine(2251)-2'-O)-methyltransferase RlmB n=3 Tax=Salimicrobium TaxID=351195 RepID=K2FGW4_9BACI|nr:MULTISPECIES: 23S rRNA (guanosine(2251)-2'-O)-methyltransferase RlmB [Salimicrobium]AKG05613.1 23S rRNA (guanosine(2251)-2'-O)-methyltransferase RlmB [Salimicrobium jeotgali]EKE30391.1 TrmH family RNA methyltransferase [Salimicrobium jeotgali]MBM7696534.1 23S rRNA (guanosine2251-2'-O)-methyltransferase [Salimicrobium jeotgali]SDY24338.1 23S rRNA (guanosine2251-2'-O)-methyltransferase [Salimicrobium album]SIS94031.1 23S rRNA (guanosine2251-2'-O)-methyltransferase [Salimicrobium salexigens]
MSGEWITGKNAVLEALKAERPINKIFISDQLQQQAAKKFEAAAKNNNILVQRVPKQKIDQLVDGNHQGVAASVAAYEYSDMEDLFSLAAERGEEPFFLILDELEDPHNLGSIIRTADASGAHGVIIPKRRSVGLTAVVAKTSAGAVEHVPVVRVTNLARTIDELKERFVWVVGTAADGAEDYRELDGTLPLALVIGNEGKGISRLTKEKCDWLVRLPMTGHVESLNASVSASLLMYEVYRNRYPAGK